MEDTLFGVCGELKVAKCGKNGSALGASCNIHAMEFYILARQLNMLFRSGYGKRYKCFSLNS